MANSPQARKRARQNEKRRLHNASQRSALRSSVKSFLNTLEAKDLQAARLAYREATSAIDQAVVRGHHHANRAARLKRRLNTRLKALAQAS